MYFWTIKGCSCLLIILLINISFNWPWKFYLAIHVIVKDPLFKNIFGIRFNHIACIENSKPKCHNLHFYFVRHQHYTPYDSMNKPLESTRGLGALKSNTERYPNLILKYRIAGVMTITCVFLHPINVCFYNKHSPKSLDQGEQSSNLSKDAKNIIPYS